MYLIYKHTLLTGTHKGWSYIGQTCQNSNHRWRLGNGYRKCTVFYKAILKYGWENFSHEIIETNIKTLEEANAREQYWIAFYNTYIGNKNFKGYNMTPGGSSRGFTLHSHSEESKEKISKSGKNKIRSDASKEKYRQAALRRPPMTEAIKQKISQTRKERQIPSPTTTKIICIETGVIYDSIKDAVTFTGYTGIPKCIQGRYLTAGGYHWRKYSDLSKEELDRIIKKAGNL